MFRAKTPRPSPLVHEMVLHRNALQANVTAASLALDGPVVDVEHLRAVLNRAELDMHALSAKTLEWATAVQDEIAALRSH